MTEAKDTVLEVEQVLSDKQWDEGGGFRTESVAAALEQQAEISFRAGMQAAKGRITFPNAEEAVKWLENTGSNVPIHYRPMEIMINWGK